MILITNKTYSCNGITIHLEKDKSIQLKYLRLSKFVWLQIYPSFYCNQRQIPVSITKFKSHRFKCKTKFIFVIKKSSDKFGVESTYGVSKSNGNILQSMDVKNNFESIEPQWPLDSALSKLICSNFSSVCRTSETSRTRDVCDVKICTRQISRWPLYWGQMEVKVMWHVWAHPVVILTKISHDQSM